MVWPTTLPAIILAMAIALGTAEHSAAAPAPKVASSGLRSGTISVSPSGAVTQSGKLLGKIPLPPGKKRLEVRRPKVGGQRLTWVVVIGRDDRRAELIVSAKGRRIFWGATGPRGVDGEWSQHLAIVDGKLVAYQKRLGFGRCDGKPAYLNAYRYDFGKGRFVPLRMRQSREKLPILVATTTPPANTGAAGGSAKALLRTPLNAFQWAAASVQLGRRSAANLTAPVEANDQRLETAWKASGAAVGAFLTARGRQSPYRVRGLRIAPGDASSEKAFKENHRLRQLVVGLAKTARFRVRFAKDPAREGGWQKTYWVVFPKPVATRCLTVEIERLYRSPKKQARTAISELVVLTELDFEKDRLQRLASALQSKNRKRARYAGAVLARRGVSALPLLEKILPQATPAVAMRIFDVISGMGAPQSVPFLVRLLDKLPPYAISLFARAMLRIGRPAVAHLVPLLKRDNSHALVAAKILGRLGGASAKSALLAQLGRGSEKKRDAIASGLTYFRPSKTGKGQSDLADKLVTLAKSGSGAQRADATMALGQLRMLDAKKKAELAAALVGIWATTKTFEQRYRLLKAVATLTPKKHLRLFVAASRDKDPVLRWVATEQLSTFGEAARAALSRALADKDPRVRTAAANGLAAHKGPQVTATLAKRLKHDRWSQPAKAAARSLGEHCGKVALKALTRAVRLRGLGIDHQALVSIAQCKPPYVVSYLTKLAVSRKQPTPLRRHAVALLPDDKLAAAQDTLLQAFLILRKQAARSYAAERVAAGIARKLGVVRSKKVGRVLADTLALEPSPMIRTAAALSLGRNCHPVAKDTLRRAAKSDRAPQVRAAAIQAQKNCQR